MTRQSGQSWIGSTICMSLRKSTFLGFQMNPGSENCVLSQRMMLKIPRVRSTYIKYLPILLVHTGNKIMIRMTQIKLKKDRKVTGSAKDFSVFFKGVLSIMKSQFDSDSRDILSSFYRVALEISQTRSIGFLPLVLLMSLGAPRIKRARRGLPVLSYSELFTAK